MPALKGSEWCWSHDPTRVKDRRQASKRGGRAKSYPTLSDGAPVPFTSIEDVQTELSALYGHTAAAMVPPDRARVLSGMLMLAIDVLNVGAFEERISALEAQLTGPRRVA
jgi:hypothetical protein